MYHLNVRSRELAIIAQTTVSLELAHRRLGHTDSRQIRRMFTMKLVEGLNLKNTKEEHRICSGCAGGKMHKTSYRTSTSSKADCIAGRINSDVCGPMPHTSLGGAQYFVIFKDEYSGWIVVNFMKSKAEVFNHLKTLHAFLKNQTSFSIKILRSDQGTEYTNAATTEWTKQMGILHEKSVTYTPQQNGTSERANRTVVESARSMMSFSKAPPELWGGQWRMLRTSGTEFLLGRKQKRLMKSYSRTNQISHTSEYLDLKLLSTSLMLKGRNSIQNPLKGYSSGSVNELKDTESLFQPLRKSKLVLTYS